MLDYADRFSSAHGGLSPLNSVPCPASHKITKEYVNYRKSCNFETPSDTKINDSSILKLCKKIADISGSISDQKFIPLQKISLFKDYFSRNISLLEFWAGFQELISSSNKEVPDQFSEVIAGLLLTDISEMDSEEIQAKNNFIGLVRRTIFLPNNDNTSPFIQNQPGLMQVSLDRVKMDQVFILSLCNQFNNFSPGQVKIINKVCRLGLDDRKKILLLSIFSNLGKAVDEHDEYYETISLMFNSLISRCSLGELISHQKNALNNFLEIAGKISAVIADPSFPINHNDLELFIKVCCQVDIQFNVNGRREFSNTDALFAITKLHKRSFDNGNDLSIERYIEEVRCKAFLAYMDESDGVKKNLTVMDKLVFIRFYGEKIGESEEEKMLGNYFVKFSQELLYYHDQILDSMQEPVLTEFNQLTENMFEVLTYYRKGEPIDVRQVNRCIDLYDQMMLLTAQLHDDSSKYAEIIGAIVCKDRREKLFNSMRLYANKLKNKNDEEEKNLGTYLNWVVDRLKLHDERNLTPKQREILDKFIVSTANLIESAKGQKKVSSKDVREYEMLAHQFKDNFETSGEFIAKCFTIVGWILFTVGLIAIPFTLGASSVVMGLGAATLGVAGLTFFALKHNNTKELVNMPDRLVEDKNIFTDTLNDDSSTDYFDSDEVEQFLKQLT
ncbi:MAG: DUF2207 domain-containing protein [Gammaproteobacteria bacterium]|nr:DUF2207 domain-containing protein [Gammaproteobacteria bacterium]